MDHAYLLLSLSGFWLWLLSGLLQEAKGYPFRPAEKTRKKLLILTLIPLLLAFVHPLLD